VSTTCIDKYPTNVLRLDPADRNINRPYLQVKSIARETVNLYYHLIAAAANVRVSCSAPTVDAGGAGNTFTGSKQMIERRRRTSC